MKKEKSAGGVVLRKDDVLLLKRFAGNWVLPKGHIEKDETAEIAALREVREETGVGASIDDFLGEVYYTYRKTNGTKIGKTVLFFRMTYEEGALRAQREEGFERAAFIPVNKAMHFLSHAGEREMLRVALKQEREA